MPAYAPQEGAPAPTDFPQSPRGDETPVDQGFVPQAYTVPQPSMLPSATLQPQMVVRDGRLVPPRDPRTGREVEIAPKEGALVPTAAVPAEMRRLNVRLLLAAIGGTVLLDPALRDLLLPARSAPAAPGVPNRQVQRDGGRSHRPVPQDQAGRGRGPPRRRHEEAAQDRDLGHVSAYIRLRKSAGPDFDKFNCTEGNRYLDSIEHCQEVSQAARAFVSEQTQWIRTERDAKALLDEALDAVRREENPGRTF